MPSVIIFVRATVLLPLITVLTSYFGIYSKQNAGFLNASMQLNKSLARGKWRVLKDFQFGIIGVATNGFISFSFVIGNVLYFQFFVNVLFLPFLFESEDESDVIIFSLITILKIFFFFVLYFGEVKFCKIINYSL